MKFLIWEDIKSLLALEKDEEDYPSLILLEQSAATAIESELGRWLKRATYIETFQEHGNDIPLKGLPVDTLVSVTIDGTEINTVYRKIRFFGLELLNGYHSDTKLIVKYTGGFSKLPEELYRAILLQTAYEWQSKDQIGASVVTNEGGTVSRPALQLLPEVKRLIKSHIHPLKGIW